MEDSVIGRARRAGTVTQKMPFGRPDGGRSDPQDPRDGDPLNDFVYFDERYSHRGLGMDGSDRTVRVIVGKKGAGKTLYLRRLYTSAVDEPSIYADEIQQGYPKTDEIARICNLYPHAIVVEKWMAIWKAAILRSVVSHILCNERLPSLDEVQAADLNVRFKPVLQREFMEPQSIYSQVREIINFASFKDRGRLNKYLANPLWEELEYKLGSILSDYPPLFFYVDAIDEEFRHAPMYWLMCQKGLFYQVFRLLNDSRIGGRLHVTICVRDVVYSSTQATEHGTRFQETTYIHTLDWNRGAIQHFLAEKLARIPGSPADSVPDWLGTPSVQNGRSPSGTEDIERYLLRHTRLIPRDIVLLGNKMCNVMNQRKSQLTDFEIRAVVKQSARQFGSEQLAACANHIASDLMPSYAAELGYSDIYTDDAAEGFEGGNSYHRSLADDLRGLIGSLRRDRVGRDTFERFAERAREHFDEKTDPVTALWQNGLIGYIEGSVRDGEAVFYSSGREDSLRIPSGKRGYALHPILIDTIDELRGVGLPVEP